MPRFTEGLTGTVLSTSSMAAPVPGITLGVESPSSLANEATEALSLHTAQKQ